MAEISNVDWISLPTDVVVHIMSFLNSQDRNHAALVCQTWLDAYKNPLLWKHFNFWFLSPAHQANLVAARKYGRFMKKISLAVNQILEPNRKHACALLEEFSRVAKRRLSHFKIKFIGDNPLFYSGQEFLHSLSVLFSAVPMDIEQPICGLQLVDLSEILVPIDDKVIDILSENHPDLKYLDVQNNILVCKVTPACILRCVQRCKNLRDLRVYHCSMSDDILEAMSADDRASIEHLSIICRREEKYGADLQSDAWKKLAAKCPSVGVTLGFDHNCPYYLIPVIMKPEIPVRTLKLKTFAICHDDVNLAASYYRNTLTKLIINSRNSEQLEESLLNVARSCTRLRSLEVYCTISQDTIDEIFRLHPDMQERKTYILKSQVEPEPWVVGVEEGD